MTTKDVVVVIGTGGMGAAVACRQGPGRTLVLADVDGQRLEAAAGRLRTDGMEVHPCPVDVSSRSSVADLAGLAASRGPVRQVVHTAGLSPVQAAAEAILRVDLLGVALVLDEFGEVVADGGAGVVVASMAAHMAASLTAEQERALAEAPADELLGQVEALTGSLETSDPGSVYALAKRANQLRVQAASGPWGERGARVNSVSPGIVSTSMGREELASANGPFMQALVEASPAGRLGTPQDVASAVVFLLGPDASFVTGTDLLVDGGAVAAFRSGRVGFGG